MAKSKKETIGRLWADICLVAWMVLSAEHHRNIEYSPFVVFDLHPIPSWREVTNRALGSRPSPSIEDTPPSWGQGWPRLRGLILCFIKGVVQVIC